MSRNMVVLVVGLVAAAAGYGSLVHKAEPDLLVPGPNGTESITVPTKQDSYAPRDFKIKVTLPSGFFHERNRTWIPPLFAVGFALNLKDKSPTSVSPIEDLDVVVVRVHVVNHDAIDAGWNKHNPRYLQIAPESADILTRYGLNYISWSIFPADPSYPKKEVLFDNIVPHKIDIGCRPSGNSYPSLCILRHITERGGGKIAESDFAVITEVTFRHERLAEWQAIDIAVARFLAGKIVVIPWGTDQ